MAKESEYDASDFETRQNDMREHLFDACENIDAGIFSGDLIYVEADREGLRHYLGRWQRALDEYDASKSEEDADE